MHRAISATLGVAALLAVPATASADSVIVKYKAGESRTAVNQRAGVTEAVGSVAATGAQVVQVAGDAKAAAATLSRSAAVEYAEPNLELRAFATPNDARFGELYGLNNANDAVMDAPEGWDLAGLGGFPASGGVKVGIVDTGIDRNHEDLAGKTVDCAAVQLLTNAVREGTCTDQNDHGTHVAGTIGATANNGVGVAGVSFNSQFAICRALNALGSGTTAGVANCITYLAGKGVKVISMSLGGGSSTTLQTAVRNATNSGSLIIAAAGNDGDATLNYPAAYAEVVSRRRDRSQRRARLVLERQQRRRDRRGRRRRALDQARRRLRGLQRHLDGDAARGRRGRDHRRPQPVLRAGPDPRQAPDLGRRPRRPRAATPSSASAA